MPTDQKIEPLIRAAKLHVRLERNRVVPLGQGIQELVHRNGLSALVALRELVALEHAGDGVVTGDAHEIECRHRSEASAN